MADKINIAMADGYYSPSAVLWLLAEELTLRQAALLLFNEDPENFPLAEYPKIEDHVPRGCEVAYRPVFVSPYPALDHRFPLLVPIAICD